MQKPSDQKPTKKRHYIELFYLSRSVKFRREEPFQRSLPFVDQPRENIEEAPTATADISCVEGVCPRGCKQDAQTAVNSSEL